MTKTFLDGLEVYAVPGQSSIIDAIHPTTGLTLVNQETYEQVRERCPTAERYTWEAWRQLQIEKQSAPLTFSPSTAEQYDEMLNVLPPAAWLGDAFLVGEPYDHDFATGRPRFQMYRKVGQDYQAGDRPVTVAEFRERKNRL